jgi:tetratricopeptide (TPR) repeat protein
MATTEAPPQPVPARVPVGGAALLLDAAVVIAAVVLVAFPVLARIAAERLPLGPPAALAPLPPVAHAGALRDLPVGLRPGPAPASVEDLRAPAAALLGTRQADQLLAIVRTGRTGAPREGVYPYRYPTLEPLLAALPPRLSPAQVAAATDLGARLTLLELEPVGRTWAAPAAYALFDRARAGGACDPSLDLLLLVASDERPDDPIIAAEGERARRACSADPTPGWLLGQYQSIRALPDIGGTDDPAPAAATFRRLVRDFPGAAPAWAGQADAFVRRAMTTPEERPWVARHLYERALAQYRRAARLRPGPEADFGVAWALAGLGRAGEAAAAQRKAIAASPPAALPQAQLVVYLEAAHRFGAAAAAADRLRTLDGAGEQGPGLFPAVPMGPEFEREDAYGLISNGAGRLRPLSLALLPHPPSVAPRVAVADFSFLPVFRESPGLTGSDRWCADWARRRDLVLAGRPAQALAGFPAEFEPPAGHDHSCGSGFEGLVEPIAQLELGRRKEAVKSASRVEGESVALSELEDERQNLWRWAGDLPRAERVAREWARSAPRNAAALLQLGEIEFLEGRHNDAARDFGASARRAVDRTGEPTTDEAGALLDRGAALVAAGRRDEGEQALREADDVASRLAATADNPTPFRISYHARVQLGEAEREAGHLPAAAEAYAAARERVPQLAGLPQPVHVEQLDNNAAIVDIGLGRLGAAETATRGALAVDPENPAFLMTAGFAAARAGHSAAAIRLNRAALVADQTAFPAANDLGVLLARAGRDEEAVRALRRAVGADEGYALGWFNLGVVLAGMGPAQLLSSQGALARAFTLDPALRDRERTPTLDAKTYRSGLDVSRPLPPEWTFAASQRHAPAKTAGLVALLAAAFALSRALTARGSGRALADTWLGPLDRASGRLSFLRRLRHPAIAIAVTLLVLLLPLARDPGGGVSAAVAGALGLVVLVGIALRGRALVARREATRTPQQAWPPGMAFGLGAALAGLLWTPLPVLGPGANARLHWAAPAALALVALPLVLATAVWDIPLTRGLAAAALVMAASLLTPVKPVDGGAIAAAGGVAAGLAGIVLAVVLALGLA